MNDSDFSRRAMLSGAAVVAAGAAAAQVSAQGSAASTARPGAGKAAVVTGSSRGIGAAIAKRLARDGYAVTVNCLTNRNLATAVVREIEASGGRAIFRQGDVADPRAVKALFDANQEAFGGVDVVVNNAGIMRLAPFAEMTDADFDRMIATNLKGGFNVLREAARRIRPDGSIVSLSSTITMLKTEAYGPYAATKAANEMYSGALAKELGDKRVSVNAIAPGMVNTTLFTDGKTPQQIQGFVQRTPFKRLAEPEDIANTVSTLVSRDGHWTTGQVIISNGGIA
jgi:3-oxoacyl-[acyl-carrier protein] reductase